MDIIDSNIQVKPLYWIMSAKKDLLAFPGEVLDTIGYHLFVVQIGGTPNNSKPLKAFKGAAVWELIENYDTDTYRVVYTVRFRCAVYVLHSFKKKSKQGIKTPSNEIEIVRQRLRAAEEHYRLMFPDNKLERYDER